MYSLITAFDDNFGIGYRGGLPWGFCRDDMDWFVRHTSGKLLLCGYRTYCGLDKVKICSRGRDLLVMPSDFHLYSREEIVCWIGSNNPLSKDVIVIGGGFIYDYFLGLGLINRLYLTWFRGNFLCDVYFPYGRLCGVHVCDSELLDDSSVILDFSDIFVGRGYRNLLHTKRVSDILLLDGSGFKLETRYFDLFM